jgi:hypothetical protein
MKEFLTTVMAALGSMDAPVMSVVPLVGHVLILGRGSRGEEKDWLWWATALNKCIPCQIFDPIGDWKACQEGGA